jgi:dTDP-4-dehydrorhamnose reductase
MAGGGLMTRSQDQHILFFGFGFCAAALAPLLARAGWQMSATLRDRARAPELEQAGVAPLYLDTDLQMRDYSHVLVSAPPARAGNDPAFDFLSPRLAKPALSWIGYLSTTGVYGDHNGAWIDEETPPGPRGARGQRRATAEQRWSDFAETHGFAVQHFRLAGIYGPMRNALSSLKAGTARRIDKPGQVFSRIHVDDIAKILFAALHSDIGTRNFSVCDDEPAPPAEIIAYAAALLGVDPPPVQKFADADLSDMARSFYAENKRIRNDRIKTELGVTLTYPTYREGLNALFNSGAF